MSTRRLYFILMAVALAALLTLGARAAFGALAPHAAQDSANLDIDSATRSYMAWAKAIEERQLGQSDDRAEAIRLAEARTAWAKALAEPQTSQIDSATRSYMAWAKYIEEQQNAARPTTAP